MKNLFLSLLLFFLMSGYVSAQKTSDLFMYKEITKAYENGTRSFDGKPGKNYFVNKADYVINAEFNPETRILTGKETITYTNNSTDTLKKLVFNIYQDIMKKGNARDWDLGPEDITDGVFIKSITVNGDSVKLEGDNFRKYASIMVFLLSKPLAPKSFTKINIEWNFTLAGVVPVRNGTYEGDNFLIAYWYPKIAVYDDIYGWNNHGYTGRYEFYNDNGNYDIKITVPKLYNVWATGELTNAQNVFTSEYVSRIEKARKSNTVFNIITADDRKNNDKITLNSDKLTWNFKSENTPDFTFAVSKTYLWDGASANAAGKPVFINVVYKPESESYKEVTQYTKEIVEFYSNDFPAIQYPYPQVTVFNGGGGMEFPGMVNDGTPKEKDALIYLTAHEVGHSYFPFYTGLNEQKYAWMDEGLISFFPLLATQKVLKNPDYKPFKKLIFYFNQASGTCEDIPLYVMSENTGPYAYRHNAYYKPAIMFYTLYNFLGEDIFKKALQNFAADWNGKHPASLDLLLAFDNVANQNLAWFWKPWFYEFASADMAVSLAKTEKNKTVIYIENKGGLPLPVNLTVTDDKGSEYQISLKSDVWKNSKKTNVSTEIKNIKKVEINTENVPDINSENNIYILQ